MSPIQAAGFRTDADCQGEIAVRKMTRRGMDPQMEDGSMASDRLSGLQEDLLRFLVMGGAYKNFARSFYVDLLNRPYHSQRFVKFNDKKFPVGGLTWNKNGSGPVVDAANARSSVVRALRRLRERELVEGNRVRRITDVPVFDGDGKFVGIRESRHTAVDWALTDKGVATARDLIASWDVPDHLPPFDQAGYAAWLEDKGGWDDHDIMAFERRHEDAARAASHVVQGELFPRSISWAEMKEDG